MSNAKKEKPAGLESPSGSSVGSASSIPGVTPWKGTIVVMDDDESVRETLETMLKMLGYAVVGFGHGQEVLDYFAEAGRRQETLAAIFLDLIIKGGLGGRETVAALREMGAQMPVFVASGYSDSSIMTTPEAFGFTAALSKPFSMRELGAVLTRYLGCRNILAA